MRVYEEFLAGACPPKASLTLKPTILANQVVIAIGTLYSTGTKSGITAVDYTSLFQLIQVVGYMLLAPTIRATNLGRVVTDLYSLENRNNTSANSTEVKFDL